MTHIINDPSKWPDEFPEPMQIIWAGLWRHTWMSRDPSIAMEWSDNMRQMLKEDIERTDKIFRKWLGEDEKTELWKTYMNAIEMPGLNVLNHPTFRLEMWYLGVAKRYGISRQECGREIYGDREHAGLKELWRIQVDFDTTRSPSEGSDATIRASEVNPR